VGDRGLVSGITAGLGIAVLIQSFSILAFGPRSPDLFMGLVLGSVCLLIAGFLTMLLNRAIRRGEQA
jgi:hypothetical protein